MEYYIIPEKEALGQCTWCRSKITDQMEVFGIGAKLRPDADLSDFENHCIQIDLVSEARSLYMMVTADGSEAKNDGNDGMFLICSEACGRELKHVLNEEIALGKLFNSVQSDFA